jgi:hypothetical protein
VFSLWKARPALRVLSDSLIYVATYLNVFEINLYLSDKQTDSLSAHRLRESR